MGYYRIKYPFSERDAIPCVISGVGLVDLTGRGYEVTLPDTIHGPGKVRKVRGANQKELKLLYDLGHRMIEFVEEETEPEKAPKKKGSRKNKDADQLPPETEIEEDAD